MEMPYGQKGMLQELSALARQFDTIGPTVTTLGTANVYLPFAPGRNNRWAIMILAASIADTRITWNPKTNNANEGIRLEASNFPPLILKFSDIGSVVQYQWFARTPNLGSTITWAEIVMIG